MAKAVLISGRVMRVRARHGGGWRVRLSDTGGKLAAAEIRPAHPLSPPPVGARVVFRGCIHYDEEHGWYSVDPVQEWLPERGK
jgi:hypothetical protein